MIQLSRPPTRGPTYLPAPSLAAAAGVASANAKHAVAVARPISGKALPLAACFVSIQSNRDWIWALFAFGRRRPKFNSGMSCALLRHVDQTKSEETAEAASATRLRR